MKSINPFDDLTFDKFRELARTEGLNHHEKVGFPSEYREGRESDIFADVRRKLTALNSTEKVIVEVGPGCSQLPVMLAQLCDENNHSLHFVDSQEMLDQLPDGAGVKKWAGRYPGEVNGLLTELEGKVDALIAYSVIQYVYAEGNLWDLLDRTLELLNEGGEVLFGDVPNITMRKRFFASSAGLESHRQYTGRDEKPEVKFNTLERGQMDDSVVFALLSRARAQGFHAWVLPQANNLPMANRREDILIRRP